MNAQDGDACPAAIHDGAPAKAPHGRFAAGGAAIGALGGALLSWALFAPTGFFGERIPLKDWIQGSFEHPKVALMFFPAVLVGACAGFVLGKRL